MGCKILKVVTWPWPRPFRDDLSSAVWSMLWLIYPPNLNCVASSITEIWNVLQNEKMGWFWVTMGHPRSSAMPPLDIAHMISYSSLIETMRLSCTVFEIRRVICRNSPTSTYPTCICRPRWRWPHSNFEDFWHPKTRIPGLPCGVVCAFLCLAILVERRLVTNTDTQTHGHSIYRAKHSSRGKN